MKERIMTEKQVKVHRRRLEKMREKRRPCLRKASAVSLQVKSGHPKAIDPDKTKEYETRFSNIWVAIKRLESRIIELESKEE